MRKSICLVLLTALALTAAASVPADPAGDRLEARLPQRFPAPEPDQSPAQGKFLVASRQIKDPHFMRTVILLIEYGKSGAVGLIVNRPTKARLSEALPEVEGLQERDDFLYFGGPVALNELFLLVRSETEPEDSTQVFGRVYASSSEALLKRLSKEGEAGKSFRGYMGYSGWAPGQLEDELTHGDWHVIEADEASIFEKPPEEVWPDLIRRTESLQVMLGGQGAP
jgi:putative transcriptional regulator